MKKVQNLTGDELGLEIEEEEAGGYTARQERVIPGFEDIIRFFKTNGRPPQHSHDGDTFDRIYAVRLDQLRKLLPEEQALLIPMDTDGLLMGTAMAPPAIEIDDDDLLAELDEGGDDIGVLRHVRPTELRRDAPEQLADRLPCGDFAQLNRPSTRPRAI